MIKYNIGCGKEIFADYINCDIFNGKGVDVVCPVWELRDKDYKFLQDSSIDEIRASHVIEHVSPDLLKKTVDEWYRVLKPEGKVFVYCPNAALIFSDYLDGQIPMIEASRFLFGEHDFSGNVHHVCFDQARLNTLLMMAGFSILDHNGRPDAYRYELGATAVKL